MPRLRLLVLILIAVAVPFQAALAVSAGPVPAMEQCHHDGHDKASGSHCGACCAAAAITSVISPLPASPVHGTVRAVPGLPPLGDLPGGLDRPPRAL